MKKLSMLSVMAIALCVTAYAGHISPGGSNIVVNPQGKLFSDIPSMESDKNGQLVPEAHSSQFLKIMFGGIRNNGLDTESIENNRAY